ncbi:acyl carrier protein [Streptomyces sp. TRM66268-LWL]|uniref:Acyl carrier protein n=1 Tax=Streptomyces polyasparticus TaxID=2767826 RepID=A0ABR7SXN0_9ACTN|nr:acyl carrier protein [Streptomyces polyasparticus]MBC9719639.1 acyl carrier protein [Streptomyces polyasparticus]
MEDIYAHLVTVLTSQFRADADEVRQERSLAALKLDSLAVVELFLVLEERWDLPPLDDEGAGNLTARGLAQRVADALAAPAITHE